MNYVESIVKIKRELLEEELKNKIKEALDLKYQYIWCEELSDPKFIKIGQNENHNTYKIEGFYSFSFSNEISSNENIKCYDVQRLKHLIVYNDSKIEKIADEKLRPYKGMYYMYNSYDIIKIFREIPKEFYECYFGEGVVSNVYYKVGAIYNNDEWMHSCYCDKKMNIDEIFDFYKNDSRFEPDLERDDQIILIEFTNGRKIEIVGWIQNVIF